MAQAFTTTYEKSYKWHEHPERRGPCLADMGYYDLPPAGDMWLEQAETIEKAMRKYTTEQLEKMVHKLYKNRMISEYQYSYDHKRMEWDKKERTDSKDAMVGNELLEYGNRLFSRKTKQNILKPLATTRKLYGYVRPSHMYTGLTEYQDVYVRNGYESLKEQLYGIKKEIDTSCF